MSDIDLLDLFGGGANPRKTSKSSAADGQGAPIELMSQFLVNVTQGNMKEAIVFCNQILEIEPDNKLMLDYRRTLTSYIDRGLDEEDDEWEDDDDDDDGEDQDDEEDEEDEEEEDENGDNSEGEEANAGKLKENSTESEKKLTAVRASKKAGQGESGAHKIVTEVRHLNSNSSNSNSSSSSNSKSSSATTNKSKK